MCKKRKIITITVLFVLGVAVSYLQWGREIDVVGSMELKGLIREALIKMILGFDIALEIEEE